MQCRYLQSTVLQVDIRHAYTGFLRHLAVALRISSESIAEGMPGAGGAASGAAPICRDALLTLSTQNLYGFLQEC